MTTDFALFYATRDGHTRDVAFSLAGKLMDLGGSVSLLDVERIFPEKDDLATAEQIILLMPVRYGYHLPVFDRLMKTYGVELRRKRVTVVSFNLTARKAGKNTPETNPYLRKWLKKHAFVPENQVVFAGKLHYELYRWWEKQIIRVIMKITGGPTQLDTKIDFMDWARLDVLAEQLAAGHLKKEDAAA